MNPELQTFVQEADYDDAVNTYYESIYRFSFSLTHREDQADDLTQETFCRLMERGGQVRDHSKIKSWLFTTTYRIFLGWKRRENRVPHLEIGSVDRELPALDPTQFADTDEQTALEALLQIDERFRAPLMLYYLEDLNYREIAELLEIPIGTVMSRLSRGKDLLRKLLAVPMSQDTGNIVPFDPVSSQNPSDEQAGS